MPGNPSIGLYEQGVSDLLQERMTTLESELKATFQVSTVEELDEKIKAFNTFKAYDQERLARYYAIRCIIYIWQSQSTPEQRKSFNQILLAAQSFAKSQGGQDIFAKGTSEWSSGWSAYTRLPGWSNWGGSQFSDMYLQIQKLRAQAHLEAEKLGGLLQQVETQTSSAQIQTKAATLRDTLAPSFDKYAEYACSDGLYFQGNINMFATSAEDKLASVEACKKREQEVREDLARAQLQIKADDIGRAGEVSGYSRSAIQNAGQAIHQARSGCCTSFALASAMDLLAMNHPDIKRIETVSRKPKDNIRGSHCFVVLNRAEGSDIQDPSTWGPNALIVDTWLGSLHNPSVYTLEEFALTGFLGTENAEIIRNFDSSPGWDEELAQRQKQMRHSPGQQLRGRTQTPPLESDEVELLVELLKSCKSTRVLAAIHGIVLQDIIKPDPNWSPEQVRRNQITNEKNQKLWNQYKQDLAQLKKIRKGAKISTEVQKDRVTVTFEKSAFEKISFSINGKEIRLLKKLEEESRKEQENADNQNLRNRNL